MREGSSQIQPVELRPNLDMLDSASMIALFSIFSMFKHCTNLTCDREIQIMLNNVNSISLRKMAAGSSKHGVSYPKFNTVWRQLNMWKDIIQLKSKLKICSGFHHCCLTISSHHQERAGLCLLTEKMIITHCRNQSITEKEVRIFLIIF